MPEQQVDRHLLSAVLNISRVNQSPELLEYLSDRVTTSSGVSMRQNPDTRVAIEQAREALSDGRWQDEQRQYAREGRLKTEKMNAVKTSLLRRYQEEVQRDPMALLTPTITPEEWAQMDPSMVDDIRGWVLSFDAGTQNMLDRRKTEAAADARAENAAQSAKRESDLFAAVASGKPEVQMAIAGQMILSGDTASISRVYEAHRALANGEYGSLAPETEIKLNDALQAGQDIGPALNELLISKAIDRDSYRRYITLRNQASDEASKAMATRVYQSLARKMELSVRAAHLNGYGGREPLSPFYMNDTTMNYNYQNDLRSANAALQDALIYAMPSLRGLPQVEVAARLTKVFDEVADARALYSSAKVTDSLTPKPEASSTSSSTTSTKPLRAFKNIEEYQNSDITLQRAIEYGILPEGFKRIQFTKNPELNKKYIQWLQEQGRMLKE
jgi:hypothetical protein